MKNQWQKEMFRNKEYWGKIIAIADDKIIAVADDYDEIFKRADAITPNYHCFTVPKRMDVYHIRTFRIKSIQRHEWNPNYQIGFVFDSGRIINKDMLIDSGADISVVNYRFGEALGFKKDEHDTSYTAEGFASTVNFYIKEAFIEIDGHRFKNRFAWLQDPELTDMIIGREIVFDLFDIEFKQADEEIIFRKRE
ncbi:MAG: hypothetical protein QG635_2199 [Bacteroidota bacterium]|nr:hypothetical protein [Bacteroidota bacterium]